MLAVRFVRRLLHYRRPLSVQTAVRMASSSPSFTVPTIQLDKQESAVLDLIDGFTKHLASTRDDLPAVECRVAGGWVRDKLLGYESDDLDVCISSLTGHHFATLLEGYLQTQDAATSAGAITQNTKIAKIMANPDQSKHLETARMTVGGLEIDLVQLRSEEYASDSGASGSRIPTSVKFGTPLEDALRRDITINTLFYNVHSHQVEDHTGQGLRDLLSDSPLIRTPLQPLQTFLDDPLRILRCIRFASRLNYPLHPDIRPAVQDDRVRHALLTKVSKERIGVELDKMLKGRDPLQALRLIHHLSLYDLLFSPISSLETSEAIPPTAGDVALQAGEILQSLVSGSSGVSSTLLASLQDKVAVKRLWLAVAVSPLRDITYIEKKKTLPLTHTVVGESVKLPNTERNFVGHIHAAARKLSHPSLNRLGSGTPSERSTIGLLLRDADVHDLNSGLDWRTSVLFSMIMDLQASMGDDAAQQEVIRLYEAFVARVAELHLDERAFEKPRLDGKQISAALGQPPGKLGKLLAILLQRVVVYQLDNPDASAEDCEAFIKGEYESGRCALPAEEEGSGKEQQQQKPKPPKKKRKESI